MVVQLAERVVLDRGRVEGDDRGCPAETVRHEHRRDLRVDEQCVERTVTLHLAHCPPRPDPGTHRPVAITGDLRPARILLELDRREVRTDPSVGTDQALQVVRMRGVAERLLEHETDSRR